MVFVMLGAYWALVCLIPPALLLWRGVGFLSKPFSASNKMVMWFYFLQFVWWLTFRSMPCQRTFLPQKRETDTETLNGESSLGIHISKWDASFQSFSELKELWEGRKSVRTREDGGHQGSNEEGSRELTEKEAANTGLSQFCNKFSKHIL